MIHEIIEDTELRYNLYNSTRDRSAKSLSVNFANTIYNHFDRIVRITIIDYNRMSIDRIIWDD